MTPDQFQRLLDKFSRGECTPEEEQFITDWYNRIGDQEPSNPVSLNKEHLEARLWTSINPNAQRTARARRWRTVARAAAITIPLLILAFLYMNRFTRESLRVYKKEGIVSVEPAVKTYTNTGKDPLTVALADGSVVILEPASELKLAGDFGETSRQVHLNGEGFFNIAPDEQKPFVVYANEVVTRVLGTSFRIRAYQNDQEVTVAVKTGKVSVYANKQNTSRRAMQSPELILTPNEQITYHRVREVISKTLVRDPQLIAPDARLPRMQFDNTEVSEILDQLARSFNVKIIYDESVLRNCRLTTSMSDEGLYERIAVICKAIGASYTINEDATISIKSEGC